MRLGRKNPRDISEVLKEKSLSPTSNHLQLYNLYQKSFG